MTRLKSIAPLELIVPTLVVVILSIVSSMGFRGVFPDWTFASAAIIGAVGAASIMLATRWARLVPGEALLLSLVGFVFLGAVAVGGVPTPDSFGTFFEGLVKGWAQVLSSSPPADLTPQFRVLPFTIAWAASMLGTELIRSTRLPGIPAIGPILALAVSLLVTIEDRTVALAQGAIMVVGAVLLGTVQQRLQHANSNDEIHVGRPGRSTGLTVAGIGLVLIAAVAPVLGPRMPLANANDRFDLRRYQNPPFDPLLEPSPLTQIKASLQKESSDKVVFSATTSDGIEIARWPIAIGRTYDGVTWAVADERRDATGEFKPVDSIFPGPTVGSIDAWRTVTSEITIVDYSSFASGRVRNVWLPSPGWPETLTSDVDMDVRFNPITGTMALPPSGPPAGLIYTITAAVPPEGLSDDVRGAKLATGTSATGDQMSPPMRSFAADMLEGAASGWPQVEAIQLQLQDGFYSSERDNPESRSGHSSHRLTDFVNHPERLVGFEEQYAATAALIARANGIPARVVIGYRIPDDELSTRWLGGKIDVRAGDMSAWIEVDFEAVGWVPFDVTPPRDRKPQAVQTGVTEREVAAPNPPPPPPPPILPPQLDQEQDLEKAKQADESDDLISRDSLPVGLIAAGAAVASPVILLAIALVVISALKTKRSKRRRGSGSASRKVAGAWQEVVDRLSEEGFRLPSTATPNEYARGLVGLGLVGEDVHDTVLNLATQVNHAAYHPAPATDRDADMAWDEADQIISEANSRLRHLARLRSKLDPRPLMKPDPIAIPKDANVTG